MGVCVCVMLCCIQSLKSQVYDFILLRQSILALYHCVCRIFILLAAAAVVVAGISVSLFYMLFG